MRTRFANLFGAWSGRLAASTAVLSLACAAAAHGGESAQPLKLRFGGDQTSTRIVLELDQAARAEVISDGAADGHVVLSFDRLKVGDGLDGQGKGLVKAWSLEKGLSRTRLSFDLSRHGRIKRRFLLPPSDGVTSYRYVVDIEADGPASPPQQTAQVALPQPAKTRILKASSVLPNAAVIAADPEAPPLGLQKISLSDAVLSPRKAVARKLTPTPTPAPIRVAAPKKVIVIDAGHGGHDPGALGGRSHEKDVTLSAARTLKTRLERGGRFRVVLTRDGDVYVPLESRVKIARAANADLFISLHADSGGDPKVRGATVYTLSDHGVDRTARSVFNGGFINVQLPGRDLSVKQILLDLTQRTTRNRSGAFAETLLEHISTEAPLLRRSHRDAGYMVLLAPDVPAVLLEMGFITSPEDEAQLNDPDRREKLMGAVGDAIEGYFADPASAPTQVASQ
jgi:N-acetylmuramoyl-L-alanine amidase